MKETVYDYKVKDIDGQAISMSDYKNKVLLIVNVASTCGFTPQYKGLQDLYEKYSQDGFEVLAFPCNQFGSQEKGSEQDIKEFCTKNYAVTFPIFRKVEINGDQAEPLFKFLKREIKGFLGTESVKWNFSKFLVNRNGQVVKRYGSLDFPENLESEIKALLGT
jgi:glutathione peroxidase